ncbi:isopenicillin N synthase family oxygenase [Shewanella sp. 202IG2-18]|uniref:isopenicillin N synthase family dioxygenase n=1 Tax=Parashewanella hymeniacidonis TaxID=2807618 RepID=UPI0019610398|nr:isopenicillin N synthase family oxygenase [Parashewanella hymeniacidonis]MBM7074151.1 isopenicillin N synthase family oxygenase [Parashewanella hymeniacidonis]
MKLEAIDYLAKDAAQQFVESLHQIGFGVLKNHPIDQNLVEAIYKEWHEFFNSEEKHSFKFNAESQDGFFPAEISETAKGYTVKDIKEYFHVYPWGQIPESLRENILKYYELANKFAAELLSWIEEHSPKEVAELYTEALSNMVKDSTQSLLRVLHYPPMTGDEEAGAIRAAAHEDINLLTVLPAANEPGLQVQDKDGSWVDVPSDFGNIIINIGDMLQEASGGYFPSTSHRVINPEGMDKTKSRISLPLFQHPRPEVVLSDNYTAHEYLMERLKELGVI